LPTLKNTHPDEPRKRIWGVSGAGAGVLPGSLPSSQRAARPVSVSAAAASGRRAARSPAARTAALRNLFAGASSLTALTGHSHRPLMLPPPLSHLHRAARVSLPQRRLLWIGPGRGSERAAHSCWQQPPREFWLPFHTAAPANRPVRLARVLTSWLGTLSPKKCSRRQHQRQLLKQCEPGRERVNPITNLTPSR